MPKSRCTYTLVGTGEELPDFLQQSTRPPGLLLQGTIGCLERGPGLGDSTALLEAAKGVGGSVSEGGGLG